MSSKVCFTLSCFVGLGLSIYAFIIEQAAEKNVNYKPMCDVNEYISCSKVFTTKYAKGFGIFDEGSVLYKPNSLAGMIFYSLLVVFGQANSRSVALFTMLACATAVVLSAYLGYLLAFVVRSLCLVCVGTYLVNLVNLMCSYRRYIDLAPKPEVKKKKA